MTTTTTAALLDADQDVARREIAQAMIGPDHLCAIARGNLDAARSAITSSSMSVHGADGGLTVTGRWVDYDWHGTVGRVTVLDLVKLAASVAHPDAVARLQFAAAARAALVRAEDERFGMFWERSRETYRSAAYAAYRDERAAAEHEFSEAAAAWWTAAERPIADAPAAAGPVVRGQQLDLFAPDGQLDLFAAA